MSPDFHDNWLIPFFFQSGFPFGVSLRKVRGPDPSFAFLSMDANRRCFGKFAHVSLCVSLCVSFRARPKTDSFVVDVAASRYSFFSVVFPGFQLSRRDSQVRIVRDLLPGNPGDVRAFLLDADPEFPR